MIYSEDSKIIKNRMLDRISSDIDKSEGYFVYDVLSSSAEELAQFEIKLDETLKRVFAKSAAEYGYSEDLEKRASEFGIYRKSGTKATGQVKFTGDNNTLIPTGTLVQTESGMQFKTLTNATITNGYAVVNIEALNIGTQYNVNANIINQLPIQIVGVISVTNELPTTGGTDIETDQALLGRLLLKVQLPATSGNVNHYKLWALEVNGIGDVKVLPLWNGNGTVKLVLIDSNKQPATAQLVNDVQVYIEEQRPIGATVTYVSATALNININVNIIKDSAYTESQVQTNIQNKIIEYLKSIAFKQDYVSYAQIGNCILSSEGVVDYNTLTVNNGTTNITVGNEEVAVLGTVTLTFV